MTAKSLRMGTGRIGLAAVAALAAAPARAEHDRRPPPPDRSGNWVWIEPLFETRYRMVEVPPVFETRAERVWVEPIYREERVRVLVPAVYETRQRRVWQPAACAAPEAGGFGVQVNVGSRRGRNVHVGAFLGGSRPAAAAGQWVTVTEQILVRPETWCWESRRVCVQPGGWTTVERQVCVRPARVERVAEQVCVRPGGWERVRACERPAVSVRFGFERRR